MSKYIVPVENKNCIDCFDLYSVIAEITGLNKKAIFDVLYRDDGNGSIVYIDDVVIEEALEDCKETSSTYKIYNAIDNLIKQKKLPEEFGIRIWW